MNVANVDCRTPRCSSSSDLENPSNRRLPPPRTTGATMIVSSSTRPASSDWRMTSAPPMTWTSFPPARDDEERQPPRVFVAPVSGCLVRPPSADDRADPGDRLREPGGVLAGRLALRLAVVCPRPAEHPIVQSLTAVAEPLAGAVVR